MTRTVRLRLTLLTILAVMIVIGSVVFSALKPTIIVNLSAANAPADTVVTINSQTVKPSGPGATQYLAKVSPGKIKVEVNSPIHSYYTEDVEVGLGAKRTVEPKLEAKKASDIAGLFFDTEKNNIANEKFFGDSWVVFTSAFKAGGDDGVIVVARLNSADGKWETVEVGTAISTDDLIGAPAGLAEYVGSL